MYHIVLFPVCENYVKSSVMMNVYLEGTEYHLVSSWVKSVRGRVEGDWLV